jgi:hypothetical protein
MKQENKDTVKVSIPKQWIKKIVPYVLTALLSVSGFAGYDNFTGSNYKYNDSYKQIIEISNKNIELESRITTLESTNRTILIQLSDIKDQNIRTQSLVENVLLKIAR